MISETANSIIEFSKLVDDLIFESSVIPVMNDKRILDKNKDVNDNTHLLGCKAINCINFNEGFASSCKLSTVSLSESGSCNQFQLRADIDVR